MRTQPEGPTFGYRNMFAISTTILAGLATLVLGGSGIVSLGAAELAHNEIIDVSLAEQLTMYHAGALSLLGGGLSALITRIAFGQLRQVK